LFKRRVKLHVSPYVFTFLYHVPSISRFFIWYQSFFFLTFQSLDLERVERKTPKKKLGEGKLLDDRNSITDNFDFDVYGFIFKRRTQWGWFSPSIMQKNLDQKWGIFFI
jgi:hypothetical protein